jgi:single-stranded-DNA-specific exonuclease
VGYVVPDRAVHGYGLTPAIVDLALAQRPQLLVTVDNGIASHAGVAHARALGCRCWSPTTTCRRCWTACGHAARCRRHRQPQPARLRFASKALAGVGVMFYVLLATRAELRARGAFDAARSHGWTRCWTWWRWARWPTW